MFAGQAKILSHFENGGDVTAFFMLGRTEILTLSSIHRKIRARLEQRRSWSAGRHVETCYDITSILEVGKSLIWLIVA